MIEAAGYLRVSTKRQGRSGFGLAAQKNMLQSYCDRNNIRLVKLFIEVASGRNDKRPVVHTAIGFCEERKLLLVVPKQCRLARSVLFIATLIARDFKFISADNPHANKLQKHLQAAIDEHASDENRHNTKQSLAAAVKKGVKLGGNSKKLKKTIRKKKKAFLKYLSPIVRKIRQDGFHTVRDITSELNRRKAKTFRGNKSGFLPSTVHKILQELSKSKNT